MIPFRNHDRIVGRCKRMTARLRDCHLCLPPFSGLTGPVPDMLEMAIVLRNNVNPVRQRTDHVHEHCITATQTSGACSGCKQIMAELKDCHDLHNRNVAWQLSRRLRVVSVPMSRKTSALGILNRHICSRLKFSRPQLCWSKMRNKRKDSILSWKIPFCLAPEMQCRIQLEACNASLTSRTLQDPKVSLDLHLCSQKISVCAKR